MAPRRPTPPGRLLAAALVALLALPVLAASQAPGSPQATDPVRVTALAVVETSRGFEGVHATIEATVLLGGSGRVYVATRPLAQADMQGSARLAAQVAAHTLGLDWRGQDYLISFTSDSTTIGGPSAGAAMALALVVALHNAVAPDDAWAPDPAVAVTGTINPDGTIGPVGGVPAKAEAAKEVGIGTFLYPAGLEVATTVVPGRFGLEAVQVDMPEHCAALGIACRAVSGIGQLVAAAAHVDLQLPDVPVPGTGQYAAVLGGPVAADVAALEGRIEAADAALAQARLAQADRATVAQDIAAARAFLQGAEDALASERYYRAATESFQGAIHVGRAERLTAFYGQSRSEQVVRDGLEDCRREAVAAEARANRTATTLSALYALGAAQARAEEALVLLAQAESLHANARTFGDWADALRTSAFCVERARTVAWWADLEDAFPGGSAANAEALADEAIGQADEMIAYAAAVVGSQGGSATLERAGALLQDARGAQARGWHPSAAVKAVEAGSVASVAVQAAGGAISAEVLQAARQGAARAIDEARGRGAEPVLAVSLVELAASQQDAAALQSYWTARSLALLGAADDPAGAEPVLQARPVRGYDGTTLVASFAVGGVLGLGLAGAGVALLRRR